LEKLNWKSISQLTKSCDHPQLRLAFPNIPENAIVRLRAQHLRHSNRLGHEWELIMPTTRLETVQSSSLNAAKKIWNALPTRIVAIGHPGSFKSGVKDPDAYNHLI
jgi:hypothetical protein